MEEIASAVCLFVNDRRYDEIADEEGDTFREMREEGEDG